MYELIYSKRFVKQVKKLELSSKERIIHVLERIRIRPQDYVRKLVGVPYFRLRVGDFRIILDIYHNELRILVLEIGHRRNIYKSINKK